MNLTKKIGALGVRGHTVLYVLIGLLVSEVSSADTSEADVSSLQLKLKLLKNRYRLLHIQYNNLAANCSASVTNSTHCPDGWVHAEDQCFFFSTDRDDFANSTAKCSEMGAHLAILTTKEQHDIVEREARKKGGISSYYWIGLTDIASEGDWRWADNSALKTPFWDVSTSQPDNNQSGGPEGEDCVVVNSDTQIWYDVPCSFIYPRVCQMDAIPLD